MKQFDVAIVGGGLAGNLLARQLRRALPEASIGLFEQAVAPSYKVGEATVEIAANYLVRRLGLSSYLYERHLPKNGLRYFFDSADRSLPLSGMSEIGTNGLPFHPAFQIDRARLESDLLAMNRNDGVQVHDGAQVERIELGEGGAPHGFDVTERGETTRWESRWLIDAAGRAGKLAHLKRLRIRETRHRIGSAWGRFENVTDIDLLGDEEFRGRVRHTARRLSTLHFWYPGYWIWFIPLRGGVTSVGVTGEAVARSRELRTPDGFRAFLHRHRAISDLLCDAKPIDFGSFARIAYGTRRFFHPDGWGVTGEAATASDPLYSPGSDFIAMENDFLSDLVARDLGGEEQVALAERCGLYDAFMQFRHEATMLLYAGLYGCQGSFELARAKWDFDIGCYYNLWVSAYMRDQHLDEAFLRRQLRLEPLVLRGLRNFAELFGRVEARLTERGEYFRENAGCFYHGLSHIDFAEEVGEERTEQEVMDKTLEIFNIVRAQAVALLGEAAQPQDVEPLKLASFLSDRALA